MPPNWIRFSVPHCPAEVLGVHDHPAAGNGWLDVMKHARLLPANPDEDRQHLVQELAIARERVAELTRVQVELTSTVLRLTELASTDVLTGLNNRRRFDEALQANFSLAMRQQSSLSVIMLDVDRFKAYNDTFGHSAGDAVLSIVAQLLVRHCRDYDVTARVGGEEFAVLLPTANELQAEACAEALRSAMESYPWPQRPVTASFGVATLDPGTMEPAQLLHEADRALYASKHLGRNRVTHARDLTRERPAGPDHGPEVGESRNADPEVPGDSPPADLLSLDEGETARTATSRGAGLAQSEPFDRFLHALRNGLKSNDHCRTALSAIRTGIDADFVLAWSDKGNQLLEIVGEKPPGASWCGQLLNQVRGAQPGGGLWVPQEGPGDATRGDPPRATSAILFSAGQSGPCWLLAVRLGSAPPFTSAEFRLARLVWGLEVEKSRHARVHVNLKETLFGTIRCLSTAIDAKDPYTCGHSERVARIAVRLGKQMGLSGGEISDLYLAGLLHDVGKIGSRDEVLLKPDALTQEEYVHIQKHVVIGERIVASVPRLAYLSPGIRYHHERMDGKGYPDGLAGEAIPLMARILAVADSCDAMMSRRRYRPGLSHDKIEAIFRQGAGTQWDPQVVDNFFACRYDIYEVCERGLGKSVLMAVERAARGEQGDPGSHDWIDQALSEARVS